MISDDYLITIEKAEKAAIYFSELFNEAYKSKDRQIKVDDKEMMNIAIIAASSLSCPDGLYNIIERLESPKFHVIDSVKNKTAQNFVHQMARNYLEGQKIFPEKTIEGAESVCKTLVRYLYLLEGEKLR